MPGLNGLNQNKISPEFATRLNRLEPQQKVRVMVLLQIDSSQSDNGDRPSHAPLGRQSRTERRAKVQAVRNLADRSWDSISRILQRFGGCPLATRPDALGAIPVEITVAGVKALATCESVKAVLEDQAVMLGRFGRG
jgi:hypothetical protein